MDKQAARHLRDNEMIELSDLLKPFLYLVLALEIDDAPDDLSLCSSSLDRLLPDVLDCLVDSLLVGRGDMDFGSSDDEKSRGEGTTDTGRGADDDEGLTLEIVEVHDWGKRVVVGDDDVHGGRCGVSKE
jgi:hypothetical protein